MKIIRELNYIFNKKQKCKLVILFIAMLIGTVLELIGVTAILPLIEAMTAPESILEKPYFAFFYNALGFKDFTDFMIAICILIIIVYLVRNIYVMLQNDIQYRFVFNNQVRISDRLMKAYMKQPYLFHAEHNSTELMRNVMTDTQAFFRAVLAAIQLVTDVCVCVALLTFLFIADSFITIAIVILFGAFMFVYMTHFKRKLKRLGQLTRDYNADMSKYSLQAFGGIKEIQILNREPFFVEQFNRVSAKFAVSQRKYNMMLALPKPAMEFICVGGLLAVVAIRLHIGVDIESFVAVLSTFAIAAFRMLPSVNKITANLGIIVFSAPSVDAIYDDLKAVEEMEKEIKAQEKGEVQFKLEKEIKVKDLEFCYPQKKEPVLRNVSITIPKNKSVAFIGPSGSGKTTLADIILGVMKPTKGSVEADGINVHDNLCEWHNCLGYIPQTIYLTDDTLKNNIAFGIAPEEINEEQLWNALEMAQLKEFVETLPDGLETRVGEGGMRLSGGQRQRIGIARALYNNPEVLVLDEATSALDNDTEEAVMDAVERLSGNVTLIIIAHRLSTIKNCDYIYQVKDGCVELTDSPV